MGALVSTVGTRILIDQLNRAFSEPRISHMRTDPSILDPSGANQPIQWYFNQPALNNVPIDLLWLSLNMKHAVSPRPNHEVFLPDDVSRRSPNAEKRWLYFLTLTNPPPNILIQANHILIKQAIYLGLSAKDRQGNPKYSRIEFDCIDGAQIGGNPAAQTVLSADEDDDHGRLYLKIVLVTAPIDPNQQGIIGGLPSLDPQP